MFQSRNCGSQVNERYMNESIPHMNERGLKDRMTMKCLKELNITSYTNRSIIETLKLSVFYVG